MGLKLNFKLDPRTKIIILVLISFMVFNEVPLYISGILVLIPFICLFFSNRICIALSYILLFMKDKAKVIGFGPFIAMASYICLFYG